MRTDRYPIVIIMVKIMYLPLTVVVAYFTMLTCIYIICCCVSVHNSGYVHIVIRGVTTALMVNDKIKCFVESVW